MNAKAIPDRQFNVNQNEASSKPRIPLLILASGPVSANLVGDLGPILASNIPLSNSLSLFLLLENAGEEYEDVYVTLDYSKKEIGELLLRKFPEIQVQFSDSENTFSETLMEFLNEKGKNLEKLDVVFGDTLVTSLFTLNIESNIILVASNTDSTNWDKIHRDNHGSLEILWKGSHYGEAGTITGGFRILDVQLIKQFLFEELREIVIKLSSNVRSSAFYDALLKYDKLDNHRIELVEDEHWVDIGHLDTYFNQRRKSLALSFRVFNSVIFDLENDWVIKTGNLEKIQNEFLWFTELPKELRIFIPSFASGSSENEYMTQFVQNTSISDSWISENTDDSYWAGLIESIRNLTFRFKQHEDTIPIEAQQGHKYSIYVEKVIERFEELQQNFLDTTNLSQKFKINGQYMPPVEEIFNTILEVGQRVSKLDGWNVIHGDLCFSNLFFDQRARKLILIDPRGSFGKNGVYGDPLYELLKLSQCALGDYDYLSTNLYDLKRSNNEFDLFVPNPESHRNIKSMFLEYFQKELVAFGISTQEFRILEAGLFLSAAPLHGENDRVWALFTKACHIVEQNL